MLSEPCTLTWNSKSSPYFSFVQNGPRTYKRVFVQFFGVTAIIFFFFSSGLNAVKKCWFDVRDQTDVDTPYGCLWKKEYLKRKLANVESREGRCYVFFLLVTISCLRITRKCLAFRGPYKKIPFNSKFVATSTN